MIYQLLTVLVIIGTFGIFCTIAMIVVAVVKALFTDGARDISAANKYQQGRQWVNQEKRNDGNNGEQ